MVRKQNRKENKKKGNKKKETEREEWQKRTEKEKRRSESNNKNLLFFISFFDFFGHSFSFLGSGIALNEALCENIFMILVCILNTIPIFVVGKPGSSKSLSMELISSNLNGKMSDVPFFQEYPAVEVFSYQCSPLSTSQGKSKEQINS